MRRCACKHACVSVYSRGGQPPRVSSRSPSSPFPHLCLFFSCLRSSLPLAHSARLRTLRDVRVCQWNTLSLSEGRREDGGGTEESVVERCRVTVVVGLGAGGGKRLSHSGYSWHIGATWRPLTFPCLSLFASHPLSLSLSFALYRSILYAPSFSISSFSPSFLFNSPGLSFCLTVPPSSRPFPRNSPRSSVRNPHMNAPGSFARTGVDPSPSSPSTLCLLVWFRSRPPPRSLRPLDAGRPLRSTPLDAPSFSPSLPVAAPPSPPLPPFPDSDVAVCYDLHSSRNKTSATVLRSRRR